MPDAEIISKPKQSTTESAKTPIVSRNPNIIESLIPIGFGVDLYSFTHKTNTEASKVSLTTSGGFGGVDAAWGGELEDDRWVADTNLKQVQVQTTCFQPCPLQYKVDGKFSEYGEIYDGYIDRTKGVVIPIDDAMSAGLAFVPGGGGKGVGGFILGKQDIEQCSDGKLSKNLEMYQKNISSSVPGRTDFFVGAAFAGMTLVHYLSHFYNITTDFGTVNKLAKKFILNVEVLFNTSGTMGKAFKIKIVDSAGTKEYAYKGGRNNCKGQIYDYDVLDIMTPLLMTDDFKEIASFESNKHGVVNGGEIEFPWHNKSYNYKNASIPGYSPTGIAGLGLKYSSIEEARTGNCLKWKTQGLSAHNHHMARVRFFVDQADLATARSIISNLPDEFAKTNYQDGGSVTLPSRLKDLSEYETVGAGIKAMADTLGDYIQKNGFHYAGPPPHGSNESTHFAFAGGDSQFPYMATKKAVDCDGYVNWILLNLGLTNNTGMCGVQAKTWGADYVQKNLVDGYIAVKITDVSQALPGDIVVYGIGASHCAIFDGYESGAIIEYGMGTPERVGQYGAHGKFHSRSYSPNHVKEFVRIVKRDA